MAYLVLSPLTITPQWNWGGTSATLRIYASESFYEYTTGEFVAQGTPGNINSFCQEITCSVSGTTVTIPEITLATTTDSSSPTATYTIILYDSSNVPRYTMASQWYVDPDFFQVQPQSSVILTNAGTTAANGVYTYRGLNNGKPYYNLEGSNDSTTISAIIWTGSAWQVKSSSATTLYTSSSSVDYPWEGTWDVSSGSSPVPTVAENTAIVVSTWENWTISNQGSRPWPQPWNAYWTIPQTQQYIASQIGDGTTPYATKLIAGKTQLSEYPAVAAEPIALGVNDAVWQGINQSVYLDSYAYTATGLNNAIAAIGSTQTELILTQPCVGSGTITIPSNILVTLQGDGAFNWASGTLTISSMTPPPPVQVFPGAGNVVFGDNATGGGFRLEWWAGIATTSDCSHAFAQAGTSLTNANGGVLHIGAGTWKVGDWTIPSRTTIQGVGSGVDNIAGTTIQITNIPPDSDYHSPFNVSGAFRYITINDLTLSTYTYTDKYCFIASGAAPDSALGLYFNNVTFYGSGVNSPAQVLVYDTASLHAWECIEVQFNNCQWMTPENCKSVYWDTVNSAVIFTNRQCSLAKGATFFYGLYSKWIQDNQPDNRGVSGLTPTATSDRVIAGTISSGTKNVALTSGSVTQNDIGQQVKIAGTFTTTITGITDATHFTVTTNAPSTFTAQTVEIYRYSPDTDGAYCIWHLVNSHGPIQLNNTVDEGFQYFLINDGSDNLSPMTINGGTIQSIIQLNAAMVLNVNGCELKSQTFEDVTGVTATLSMTVPNSMSSTNLWGVVLLEPTIWGVNVGTSRVPMNFSYGYNGTSFSPSYKQTIGIPTTFQQGVSNPGAITTPLASFMAADVTTGGPHKRLFRWGRLEATSDIPDYYYWVERDYDTGFTIFAGNQSLPYRGYNFDANVYATTYTGDVVTASITGTENDYTPGNSSMFIRLNPTAATRNITGLALSTTSLYSAESGEVHQIWNVNSGTNKLVLQNENAGSSAGNRFLTDTGADITLLPNEGAALWYDGTVSRWRVSKLNISGVTSNGTTVTSSLPMTVSGAFTGSSTANITGVTTIGTTGFRFILTPSAGGNGTAVLGNPGTNAIILDENAATLTIDAASVAIGGATSVTGAVTATGLIKSSSATAGIGYATGAGGTVNQGSGSGKATAVTSNTITTRIVMDAANLAAATTVSFTFTNSSIASTDTVIVTHTSGGTSAAYTCNAFPGSGSAVISVRNNTAGALAEAIVLRVTVIKSVSS